MAKPTTVEQLEIAPMFSQDDIKWFKRSIEKFVPNGRETYGKNLSLYEMFLISVSAVTFYPESRRLTALTYHDNDIENYMQKYVLDNHPTCGDKFRELSRPMMTDENKRKHRWIRDRFVPRAFFDELYQASK